MHVSLQSSCTYHWRPHDRIIADPHGSIIGDPGPDSRWRPLIFVGDPRFSMETPDFRWRPQIFVGMKVGLQ